MSDAPIDVSADVIQLSTQKTTKTTGKFQFHLVARRNYLNLIFPNDVVNIYIDPGDGKRGFVRTMFGFVDRIERSEVTDPKGAIATRFVIIGSDFQKAIEKTQIYFNAQMRQILDERFARTDEGALRSRFGMGAGGAVMMNAGLTLFGSPADMVENFLLILLGFGQQWRLPKSYSKAQATITDNRRKRAARAKNRIPQNVIEALPILGFNLESLDTQITDILKEAHKTLAETNVEKASELRDAAKVLDQAESLLLSYKAALALRDDPAFPAGILDLLNMDFIEALAVDGFIQDATIAQSKNQSLSQWLYGQSNEVINELIFDLRPVSPGNYGLFDGGYSLEADELGINVEGTPKRPRTAVATQYAPSVVFREYPFSVVDKLDLSDITILAPDDSVQNTAGVIYMGPIFAKNPQVPGRHTYQYPNGVELAPHACYYFPGQRAVKHIDAVTITNADVQQSNLGRSDEDTWNLLEMFPRAAGEMDTLWRGMNNNFSPILNQISIARNGLRVREETTKYARRGPRGSCKVGSEPDNVYIRQNLIRWQIMMDHWYQHNIEYLNGSLNLRGMPELRVGYRLDWADRHESYYVESVQNQWNYPGALSTTVSVTRGQRHDPFPCYIPPVFLNDQNAKLVVSSGNRGDNGRLGKFFQVRDTKATTGATNRSGPFATEYNDVDQYPEAAAGGRAVYPEDGDIQQIEDVVEDDTSVDAISGGEL
jgi:hypothetical protein